ncbi:hypothetical protein K9O30_14525 [Clostridium bowmanii]|uniref:hypothetical protein n=1 Tax=Clostridium bowmanii TaxID=132925 RepID=UPI001C0E5EEF|nr:hypothetical protein [Clostridium bowmanii]MBU3190404.1 hypothetical protein [Clostridium bowmanii]MCA1074916.1 hypothetical protein [Clostridium bowmanii]
MFFNSKKRKEIKENEARLMRINNFEVRYVTTRDPYKYGESIIGKGCVININNGDFIITSGNKIIFTHSIKGLQCSELLSQEGVILSYVEDKTGENVEVMAYYKYHRK